MSQYEEKIIYILTASFNIFQAISKRAITPEMLQKYLLFSIKILNGNFSQNRSIFLSENDFVLINYHMLSIISRKLSVTDTRGTLAGWSILLTLHGNVLKVLSTSVRTI